VIIDKTKKMNLNRDEKDSITKKMIALKNIDSNQIIIPKNKVE
jgi:hypothetical protein